jgi:hypothetical protein
MAVRRALPSLEQLLGAAMPLHTSRLEGYGTEGRLPLTADMLWSEPSGNIFGQTQNAGMGWHPGALDGPQYVIVTRWEACARSRPTHRPRVLHRALGKRAARSRRGGSGCGPRGRSVRRRVLQRPV